MAPDMHTFLRVCLRLVDEMGGFGEGGQGGGAGPSETGEYHDKGG
jgi:hypothetical protein